jgi:hypothetical protein
MILSTVLNVHKIVPDDWDRWWEIWKEAEPLSRSNAGHNRSNVGLHRGFDVYKTNMFHPRYEAKFVDLREIYPTLFEQLMQLPVRLKGIRIVQSYGDFPAHTDNAWPSWSIRTMFHCADPNPQWYYKPIGMDEPKTWLKLPEESNTWAYLDGRIRHGTDYSEQYQKIIVQYFTNDFDTKDWVPTNFDYKPEYNISYD